MPAQNFKNMDELLGYLNDQEKRIQELENSNALLSRDIGNSYVSKAELQTDVKSVLPQTGLLSRSLFARAFTVWGHFILAQLIIAAVLGVGYLLIFVLILGRLSRR